MDAAVVKETGNCPACNATVVAGDYFCHNCGRELKNKPPATTAGRQITVYLISFFFPPVGLWYGWKYVRQRDPASRKIGVAATILTVVSFILTIWASTLFMNSLGQSLGL